MDLRDMERKEEVNRLIREDRKRKEGLRSIIIGSIAVAGLIGIIAGAMCSSYLSNRQYDPHQECIERHYRALDYKVTKGQHEYILHVCGKK